MPQATQATPYQIAFRTDIGQQRSLNEDAAATFDLPRTDAAFVVCDGMGGLRAGDVASGEAVRVVEQVLKAEFANGLPPSDEAALTRAFVEANNAVNALNGADASLRDAAATDDAPTVRRGESVESKALMGTTCVAGYVRDDTLHLSHAGDSRAYLLRGGRLAHLTADHSYVAERVRAGDITEAEARVSRFRNMITRAIGIAPTVEPEYRRERLAGGDTVLVCSDGLTTMLDDSEILTLLNANARATPDRAAAALVDAANRKGGHDNVTVLILRAGGEAADLPPVAGIVEIDDDPLPAPKPGSPLRLILGIVAALLIAAAVWAVLNREARRGSSDPAPVVSAGGTPAPLIAPTVPAEGGVDYARLQYDAPVLFSNSSARGDLLAWSPGRGLFFAGVASGRVSSISPDGKTVGGTVANLEPVNALHAFPSTHVFLATDAGGNVYISYTKSRVVEKRGTDGRLLATLRGWEQPEALAVDETGNVYVVDNNLIKVCRAHIATPAPAKPSPPAAKPSPATKAPAGSATPAKPTKSGGA